MPSDSKVQNDKRKRLLHRFFEPLVLLYVLDRTQGAHLARPTSERLPLDELTVQELRRCFLDSLSYLCDFEKGGDTVTAIAVGSVPLKYYVSCNKTPKKDVKVFLRPLFTRLASVYERDSQQRTELEDEILEYCVGWSGERLSTYWKSLQASFEKCPSNSSDGSLDSRLLKLKQRLVKNSSRHYDLCRTCDSIMKSSEMTYIKERAAASEDHGNTRSPFAEVRHFIGRLAFHARSVRVLMSTGSRLPALFLEPRIKIVEKSSWVLPPPCLRNKMTIDGITKRMIGNDDALLREIRERLRDLDQQFDIERIVREEYANKNFKPCVHAELNLLEYLYQNRQDIELVGNDNFIGVSKPFCYCCFLYIRDHPGRFIEPATHQKIYLNWMPPTSIPGVQETDSELAHHERIMLNKMVESIRARTIDQIRSQTGRRQKQFDSVTGETFSAHVHPESLASRESRLPEAFTDGQLDERKDSIDEIETELSSRLDRSMKLVGSDDDGDSDEGGVQLA